MTARRNLPYSRQALLPKIFRPDVITITGTTAVGTSTLLKALADRLGWRMVSAGEIMRDIAKQRCMTIEELTTWMAEHPDSGLDEQCDRSIAAECAKGRCVADGRVPHLFTADAFHAKMICDDLTLKVRRRQTQLTRKTPPVKKGLGEIRADIVGRNIRDRARFNRLYRGWNWPAIDFDILLDNTPDFCTDVLVDMTCITHAEWVERLRRQGKMAA